MEETALPLPSSTLAPPPLETAATGTRALQRFDLGKMRPKPEPKPEPARASARAKEVPDEIEIIVTTVKMAVPPRIKELPLLDAVDVVRKASALAPHAPPPRASLVAAAWALGASASLALACSAAGAVVYALVFP